MSSSDLIEKGLSQGPQIAHRPRWRELVCKLPLLYLGVAVLVAFYLCEDEHVAVHIHWYRDNLPFLTYGDGSFGTEEFLKPFRNFGGPTEFRARFMTYFFLTIDHYLRFFLYQYERIPSGLSILWIFELISVVLFYKLIRNLTSDRITSQLGLTFYATSVGFTSGLSLMFMPGKPMTNVVFIVVAFVASEMWKRDATKLFIEHPARYQLAILLTMFVGFNFDEGAFFAPAIPPVLFPSLFLRRDPMRSSLRRHMMNLFIYLLPALFFLAFVVFVVPIITEAAYGYKFDFIATALGTHPPEIDKANYGLTGRFTLGTLYSNFLALTGPSFIPWWLDAHLNVGGRGIIKELYLVLLVAAAVLIPLREKNSRRRMTYGSLILTGLFIVFSAMLNGRHSVVVNGFYYASAIAVFMSLSLALLCDAARQYGRTARTAAICLAALPIVIQVDNSVQFGREDQSMYDTFTADWYRKDSMDDVRRHFGAIDANSGVSKRELDWIWSLWKQGRLSQLRAATISPGAVYLVAELRRIDQLKEGRLPTVLLGAETKIR